MIGALFKKTLFNYSSELNDIESALVIGCGPQISIPELSRTRTVGFDIVFSDLIMSRKNRIYNQYICADVVNICFKPKSFDIVIATHIIEHLKKNEASKVLDELELIARKKVLIGVPNKEALFGAYEWHGQLHVGHSSLWDKDDFVKRGYRVIGVDGLKILPQRFCINVNSRKKIWVRRVLQLSELITKVFPQFAYNLICIKQSA